MQIARLTTLLGVDYPILQAGMTWVSRHALAAAVSRAGALGVIGSGGMDPDELRAEIRALRALTAKPFAVNLPLINVRPDGDDSIVGKLFEVVLGERVPIVITSAGTPKTYTPRLKAAGAVVLHVVPSVSLALKAEAAGVDAIIAEGCEAGGHIQSEGLSTFVLVPQDVDAVKLPVVAAGGIADARGFAAMLALGADGVQIGTRFIATTECNAHAAYKHALVDAGSDGTAVYCRAWHASRALATPIVRAVVTMEKEGRGIDEIRALRGRDRARRGCIEGDLDEGILPAGAAVGMVKEVRPAGAIVEELVRGCASLLPWVPFQWPKLDRVA
jgi:enoyl-[acyl-carrier protein] reductase II